MARRSQDLISLTSRAPWWASLALGGVFYVFLAHLVPMALPDVWAQAFTPGLKAIGLVIAIVCLAGVIAGGARRLRHRRLYDQQASLDQIRALDWQAFEGLMAEAFRRQGYAAHLTDPGPDGGVDIELIKAGELTLVQCKQWRSRRVGVRPVRELAGVVTTEGAAGGVFVCSGTYTPEAEAFAERAGIRLIDGAALVRMILMRPDGEAPAAEQCPSCGGKLVPRVARRGAHKGEPFLGCSAFPRCRYLRPVSQARPAVETNGGT